MRGYSEDLRARVIAAVASGMAREEVVWRYAVSLATLKRWLKQWRETGDLAPKRSPGRPGVKLGALVAALPGRVLDQADATLDEHCAWWADASGVTVSTATMSRALARLRATRKKSP